MRVLWLTFLIGCATALSLGAVDLRVFRAELSSSFGSVPGKVLLHPETLTFLDDERPEASFAVRRAEISALNNENEVVVVQLSNPVKDRVGTTTRLSLRLGTQGEAASVSRWYTEAPEVSLDQRGGLESAEAPAGDAQTFQVIHKRFFGDTNGRLLITPDRLVYESINDANDSRRWEYKQIKELKLRNPYSLMINPFVGDAYNFQITGSGMNTDTFNELVNRVTQERSRR